MTKHKKTIQNSLKPDESDKQHKEIKIETRKMRGRSDSAITDNSKVSA